MTYETIIRGKGLFDGCSTMSSMIDACLDLANELSSMKKKGVELDHEIEDDYAFLTTDSEEVAKEFGMNEVDTDEENEEFAEEMENE
jgi:phage I-like protein